MPKIGNQPKNFTNNAGESYEFISITNVNSDGIFSVSFPDECNSCVINACKKTSYWTETHSKNTYIYGKELKRCHELISIGVAMFLEPELKEEIIIRYKHNCSFSAWEDRFGEFHPNGYFDKDRTENDGSGWVDGGGVHATSNTEQFMFGLGASMFKKKTYTRGAVINVIYEKVRWHFQGMDIDLGVYGEKLAGFNYIDVPEHKSKEIIYTELAAEFFFNSMIGIAKMSAMFNDFFMDDLKVAKAIENSNPLMIGINKS